MGLFSFVDDLFGGGDEPKTTVVQNAPPVRLPDYDESNSARAKWLETLNEWGDMPGYGAVSPDWDSIWKNAATRVNQYFWGGPDGPGAAATVRSNLARRGMSENPASDSVIARLGMKQGGLLSDMAVKQAIEEAQLAEGGRKSWLASLQNLAGLKPQYSGSSGRVTTSYGGGDSVEGDFFGNIASSLIGDSGMEDLSNIFGSEGIFGAGDTGIGDIDGGEDGGFDWMNAAQGGARVLGGDMTGLIPLVQSLMSFL